MKAFSPRLVRILHSRWLPWSLAGLVLLVTLLYELLRPTWISAWPWAWPVITGVMVVAGLGFTYLTVSRLVDLMEQRRRLEGRLAEAERQVGEAYQKLEAIFRVTQKFIEANDENEVIKPILRLMVDLTGAEGASFVPLDEHGQPQTALSFGELPFPVMEAWVEYLASPGVRQRCGACEEREPLERPANCPLLKGPFAAATGLLCLPVRRGERDFGVMSLFLSQAPQLDEPTRVFLRALLDEMALGLDGVYLRRRELTALRQMQAVRQKTDLSALLNSLLENAYRSLEADFAMLVASPSAGTGERIELTLGESPAARSFIDGLLQGVLASKEPVLLGEMSAAPPHPLQPFELKSLVAAPLLASDQAVLGAVLVGSHRAQGFQARQLALLQAIASQAALVVQNAGLMAELEYNTLIQERARLAREIHDGLAQTIGFLKLQAAQMRNVLGRGEIERARQSFDLFYRNLSEAYQDARLAIDGLRVSPAACGLQGWLEQMASEFREVSDLAVALERVDVRSELAPEVQAQLIRIVQEALSNVRKHANAGEVCIACYETASDLILEVRDDGDGFSPQDVTSASQHGLRGMRERAELIGADFQVISRAQEGTIVRLRLPLRRWQEVST